MNSSDQAWIENRIQAAVADDFYLDRDEEKRIKEECAARGISIREVELAIRSELDKQGAACERLLLDEFDRLLHQFTDNDRKLDNKEERDALDKVVRPAPGKNKGLDPRVAEEYVASFCKVNGIVRTTDRKFPWAVVAIVGALVVVGIVAVVLLRKDPEKIVEKQVVTEKVLVSAPSVQTAGPSLSDADKAEIDDQIRRAQQFVDIAQYTDPPEKSAKACLDRIRMVDPTGLHRVAEVKALATTIVDHYVALAGKSFAAKNIAETAKWLDRAKLMHANTEVIRDKEREYGIIKAEQ